MTDESLLNQARGFVAECETIGSLDELKRRLAELVGGFGFPLVACGRIGQTGLLDALHFENWDAAWLEHYLREEFVHIDAVPHWAAVCGAPTGAMELRRSLPPGHPALRVFEAGDRYGLHGGYIVPQRTSDNQFGVVAFVGASDPKTLEDRFALRGLAGIVFDRAEALAGRPPRRELPAPRSPLTVREREILAYLMQGRSAVAIASALEVSPATVRFHVTNLKAKTGALNTAQLTAFGASLGLSPWRA
jgi:DNA-binding CsgD family transcriptional regulator